jgi:hypothetical protein
MRLKTKVALLTIIGTTIPILLLGIITFHISKTIIKNRISTSLISSVENSIERIDRILFERSINIEQWAGNSTFRTALEYRWGVNRAKDAMLALQAKSGGTVREIALVDTQGICFVSTDNDHTAKQTNWKDTQWWQHSIDGETYYDDWQITDKNKNVSGVVFSAPIIKQVRDANSIQNYEYLGVLAILVDWAAIENELLRLTEVYQDAGVKAFALLLHGNGETLIAHSDLQSYGVSRPDKFPDEVMHQIQNREIYHMFHQKPWLSGISRI